MKIRKRTIYVVMAAALLLAASVASFFYFGSTNEEDETLNGFVDNNGYLHYPIDRQEIEFRRSNHSETENLAISKVEFTSRNGNIFGLLVIPKKGSSGMIPGLVLLPGAGVSKESELDLAKKIAELGIAVLTIDQRGVGETGGIVPTLEEDYNNFLSQKEPVQHLGVYDALRAYDLLKSAPFVDSGSIIMAGESLGGRIAIIASVVDDGIKGALLISTSGFNFLGSNITGEDIFLKSIDPDHYIRFISPRKTVMIHNVNDRNVRIESAYRTFSKAQEPKQFLAVNDTSCNHGYCESMYGALKDGIEWIYD